MFTVSKTSGRDMRLVSTKPTFNLSREVSDSLFNTYFWISSQDQDLFVDP